MTRFRWAPALLVAGVIVGLGAAAVFAVSKPATCTNHAITASAFRSSGDHAAKPGQVGSWDWLGYRQSAAWTFDATQLAIAINKAVTLNITALSTNTQLGSGYSTNLNVTIAGTGSDSFTTSAMPPVASCGEGDNACVVCELSRGTWGNPAHSTGPQDGATNGSTVPLVP
jgi:hypothetical protein